MSAFGEIWFVECAHFGAGKRKLVLKAGRYSLKFAPYLYAVNLPSIYQSFSSAGALFPDEGNLHYLLHVLRLRSGDACTVTNGEGLYARATMVLRGKKEAVLQVEEPQADTRKPSPLHLGIAFTKNPARMEWLLEKVTELGIGQITPLITARGEKLAVKSDRWRKILVSAMLQSKQFHLPQLNEPAKPEAVLQGGEESRAIAYCDEQSERRCLRDVVQSGKKTLILIGPEGDFTPEEVHLCRQHGAVPVSLGPNRLRTETAGLYATVVFNSLL